VQRQFGRRFASAAVAGVRLYHGAWCKLLGGCPEQVDVVASVPWLRGSRHHIPLAWLATEEDARA
jgi:hypothetical protein